MTKIRPSWDSIWMQMADTIGERSKCDRARVGCVLVSSDQTVLSASYNGAPSNYAPATTDHCIDWCLRAQGADTLGSNYDVCPASHAEINGIARADRSRTQGATAYVSHASCVGCAKAMAAAGVTRLVHRVRESDLHRNPVAVEKFLSDCGVKVVRWTD